MSKSPFYTVLLLIVTTFSIVDGQPVIPKDLVLYWSFDNPTVKGKVVKDVLGKRDGRLEGKPKLVRANLVKDWSSMANQTSLLWTKSIWAILPLRLGSKR